MTQGYVQSKKCMKQIDLDFLMRDILASVPDRSREHFVDAIASHMIALESVVRIFHNECSEKKPSYRVVNGCLTVLNSQLMDEKIYYAMEALQSIKTCLRDNRKTIRKWASMVLIRLTLSLRCKFILLPLPPSNAKSYLEKFKKVVNKEDLVQSTETLGIFEDNKFLGRYISEHHGVKFNVLDMNETKNNFDKTLDGVFT